MPRTNRRRVQRRERAKKQSLNILIESWRQKNNMFSEQYKHAHSLTTKIITRLKTAREKRKPLTDDEIAEIRKNYSALDVQTRNLLVLLEPFRDTRVQKYFREAERMTHTAKSWSAGFRTLFNRYNISFKDDRLIKIARNPVEPKNHP